jgi:hypothetical protein
VYCWPIGGLHIFSQPVQSLWGNEWPEVRQESMAIKDLIRGHAEAQDVLRELIQVAWELYRGNNIP